MSKSVEGSLSKDILIQTSNATNIGDELAATDTFTSVTFFVAFFFNFTYVLHVLSEGFLIYTIFCELKYFLIVNLNDFFSPFNFITV